MGCFCAEPQMPAWVARRFAVTTQVSLASALTSLVRGHTLKGNRTLLNPTLRASTPTNGEQTLPPTGL